MVSVGRVACVALPFMLAVASIIALLVAALAGVTNKNNYMFRVNTTGMSISLTDAADLLSERGVDAGIDLSVHLAARDTNITAADVGLGKLYDVNLWNYCETFQNDTRSCTKPRFDWAAKTLNNSEHTLTSLISSTGYNLTIPDEVQSAIKVFSVLAKWTEVVFLVAFGALALEILFGFFTACSRGMACLTYIVATLTVVAVVGAAGMATAMAVVVVGAIKGAASTYGVDASPDTRYLAALWIAAACAVAASFFWMFTMCCCSPDRRPSARRFADEKPASAYQPIHDPHAPVHPAYAQGYAPQYAQGQHANVAYEPYSQRH